MVKRLHLGQGQVASPDEQVWEARRLFLRAVFEVKPETYWSLFPTGYGQEAYDAWRCRWNDDLRIMIAEWQKYWHLSDPWLADAAYATLRARLRWHIQGCTALWGGDRFVTPQARSGALGGILALPIVELHWNPVAETREEARARLHALIDDELDRVETESTHPVTRSKSPDHFVWLARYQVVRESKELIADTTGHDRSQVGRAVSELAGFIGLTSREPKRGRPRRRTANTVRIRR